ncbi:MAG: DUF4349 domain-containing protein [Prochlorotrichaceae cyanobacterium]
MITGQHQPPSRLQKIVLSGLLSGFMTVGCASSNQSIAPASKVADVTLDSAELAPVDALAQSAPSAPDDIGETGENGATGEVRNTSTTSEVSPAVPQLIKTVELELKVDDTRLSIEAVQQIVRQQQGDLLQLQDTVPVSGATPHQAYLQLRVPQNRLDQTVTQLIALGQVKNQSLSAEDVSSQLVDYQARLRNLQKAEESVLEIMERSGEIGDVLKVAQELQNIRENIERIRAQLETLKTRVAFSTINVYLVEPIALVPGPDRTWSQELQTAWQASSRALGNSVRAMVVVIIWTATFSPYWLAIGGGILLYRRRRKPGAGDSQTKL